MLPWKLNRLMQDEIRSAVADSPDSASESPESAASAGLDASAIFSAERDRLQRQIGELQDQALRSRAEFENYRKRRDREQLEFSEFAGMEIVRALLPTLDDFERALKVATDSGASEDFLKGVELIYSRLMDILTKQGLEPITTEGQKFDPNIHHAIKMVQNEELDDHTILQEYQRGYNFKGRLLRAAMVEVSVRP